MTLSLKLSKGHYKISNKEAERMISSKDKKKATEIGIIDRIYDWCEGHKKRDALNEIYNLVHGETGKDKLEAFYALKDICSPPYKHRFKKEIDDTDPKKGTNIVFVIDGENVGSCPLRDALGIEENAALKSMELDEKVLMLEMMDELHVNCFENQDYLDEHEKEKTLNAVYNLFNGDTDRDKLEAFHELKYIYSYSHNFAFEANIDDSNNIVFSIDGNNVGSCPLREALNIKENVSLKPMTEDEKARILKMMDTFHVLLNDFKESKVEGDICKNVINKFKKMKSSLPEKYREKLDYSVHFIESEKIFKIDFKIDGKTIKKEEFELSDIKYNEQEFFLKYKKFILNKRNDSYGIDFDINNITVSDMTLMARRFWCDKSSFEVLKLLAKSGLYLEKNMNKIIDMYSKDEAEDGLDLHRETNAFRVLMDIRTLFKEIEGRENGDPDPKIVSHNMKTMTEIPPKYQNFSSRLKSAKQW